MATRKIVSTNMPMKAYLSKEPLVTKNTSEFINLRLQKSFMQQDSRKSARNTHEDTSPLKHLESYLSATKPGITGGLAARPVKFKSLGCANELKVEPLQYEGPYLSKTSAVANLTANRRLLHPSAAATMIGKRRYGSSASSSSTSFFRAHDDRRRRSEFKSMTNVNYMSRAYNTQTTGDQVNNGGLVNFTTADFMYNQRNQNMSSTLGSMAKAAEVSAAIRQELMPVDNFVRERISVKNSYTPPEKSDLKGSDPMSGWYHPPSPDMLTTLSEKLLGRRNAAATTPIKDLSPRDKGRKRKSSDQQTPPAAMPNMIKAGEKKSLARRATCVKGCDVTPPGESQAPAVRMIDMTARVLPPKFTEGEKPPRKFSLKRPPIMNVRQVTQPTPGPAAETVHRNNVPVVAPPRTGLTFNPTDSRHSRYGFNFKRY